ncbi:AlpA family phage regulatory protein [Shewanella sp. SG44-2]|uniref:helix-turn-helix transcriptional regulator n=1 Tax=Shewanella sp. SG44-2 TaxID=2760962 RepID=UPI001C7261A6
MISNNASYFKHLEQENIKCVDTGEFMSCEKTYACVHVSRSTIYRLVKDGLFPEPIRENGRTIGWRSMDVFGWLNQEWKRRNGII